MVVAVLAIYIVDDLSTAVHAEIDIDIRHADTLRVQKPLKEQAVFYGVNIGEAEAVRHHAARCAAAPGAYGYLLTFCVADEVGNDEEIVDKAHLLYHRKLVVELLAHLNSVGGIALGKATVAELFKELKAIRLALGELEAGQLIVAELKIVIAHLGDAHGVVGGLGVLGKERAHLRLVLYIKLACFKF